MSPAPRPGEATDGSHLLTVLHSAERTGPPLFALQFLRWLRTTDPSWRTSTLFLDEGGPLEPDFAALGPTFEAEGLVPYSAGRHRLRRALVHRDHRRLRRRLEQLGPVSVAHVHCAGSLRVLPALPPAPVLGHLHELSVGLDLHLGPLARRQITRADRYLAVSDGVRAEFLARFPVDPGLVERQWGFVDEARLPPPDNRSRLGLAPHEMVVVCSGVRHWRKAPELFVRTARAAIEQAPDVAWRFIWVGGADVGGLEDLVAAAGLTERITFLPHQDEPLAWIEAADIFLLPAREDAFPLVCVEAAAIGRPIVTFDNGGAAELSAAAGAGVVVPFPDTRALGAALVALARDPLRRSALGDAARRFARTELLLAHAGPRLLGTLQTVAGVTP